MQTTRDSPRQPGGVAQVPSLGVAAPSCARGHVTGRAGGVREAARALDPGGLQTWVPTLALSFSRRPGAAGFGFPLMQRRRPLPLTSSLPSKREA